MNQAEQPPAVHATPKQILLVDDEVLFAKAVKKRLLKGGYGCDTVTTLAQAQEATITRCPALILLDLKLPDGSGMDFLAEFRKRQGDSVPVIVLSAYGEVEDVVAAMKMQANDYLKKPIDLEELLVTVDKVLQTSRLATRMEYSQTRERHGVEKAMLLGEHQAVVTLREQIQQIVPLASNEEPPTVLILGETGTGKDLIARALHQQSQRQERPFVHVDCATLPKDLIEAELFGHERGAFTHAHAQRTGLIEAAEDGVLFLDEIGELPLELQAKLLAVLERRAIRRIGSSQERPTAAWFIAATNRDVDTMLKDGLLRSDLYFRLNVLSLNSPALRHRQTDIFLLGKHFVALTAARYRLQTPELSSSACEAMLSYPWPGNVRELKHVMERAVLLCGGDQITEHALSLREQSPQELSVDSLNDLTLDAAECLLIENALKRTGDNVSKAARLLGITRMAMRYRMKKHRMVVGDV